MLAASSMGSHSGQQNFPFGYIPNELHGIGLPDFMTPGPPPGQPLLSEHDAQHLDSFLSGFDAGGDHNKDNAVQQFQRNPGSGHEWLMPPTFVGSETSLRPRNGADWQGYQMSDFPYGGGMNMAAMNHPPEFQNGMHGHAFPSNGHYDHNLLNQLHNAAQTVQPSFPVGWQQNFQPPQASHVQHAPRPMMRFGSDSHFQPTGYAPPEGPFDPTTGPSLDWLETHSSATNTQPNTEPNTQPSSPNWTKKRKLDDYQQADHRRNGYTAGTNPTRSHPTPPGSSTSQKTTQNKLEQPLSPRSRSQLTYQQENEHAIEDEDVSYDEDQDPDSQTKSPSPSSSSRVKTHRSGGKSTRVRKKSTASATTTKAKSRVARNSTSGPLSSRVPLTADQKKANHTNSEQRRRDATARAYAELYDLVPELEEMGKQSTMKKLEIVVKKVHKVKDRVQQLRAALGFDVDTGAPLQHDTGHPHLSSGTNGMVMGNMPSDIVSWPQ